MVDSHAHLDLRNFNRDRKKVIQRAMDRGLKLIINIGIDLFTSQRSISLAEKYPLIYTSVGIHPHNAAKVPPDYLQKLEEMTHHPKVVALGEMGLDFYRDRSPRPVQREVFRQQLRLAKKVNKPIIIHDRDAHKEIVKILEEEGLPDSKGVIHCFSGDLDLAKKCLEMGFYISIAGPVTYAKNHKLREVAAAVPLKRLLIETDAPFLPPVPLRGKRNEPAYVTYVAEKVAALKYISTEDLGRICLENTQRLFSIE
ncbi:MAG: TatD family hydrolase [Firmicutes bacterium]|nr:TatD family hydrolase [Bacillota bacterium]